jgi:hypothetical protein
MRGVYNNRSGCITLCETKNRIKPDYLLSYGLSQYPPLTDTTIKNAIVEYMTCGDNSDPNACRTNSKYGLIEMWDTRNITTMNNLFNGLINPVTANFNFDITNWNTCNVIDMSGMFAFQESFNHNIGKWNVSKVNGMNGMFYNKIGIFNQDLSGWKTNITKVPYNHVIQFACNNPIENIPNYLPYYNDNTRIEGCGNGDGP